MKKLAIVTTHPVQYYAPVFKLLHDRQQIEIKVFYTWGQTARSNHDPGFNKLIEWDLPLMEGYPFEWAVNTSTNPGSHHFAGIKTPGLIAQIDLWKPDAVMVFGWAYQSHLNIMRHYHNKLPVYFRGDSTLLDEREGLKPLIKKWFLTWVYRHADRALYVGSENKRYFLKYGLKERDLHFAPHAVENVRFSDDRGTEARKIRESLSLRKEDILILFAGKFEEKKNPQLLLNAFNHLSKPTVHLLFVGNGLLEGKLKAESSKQNSGNIHFMNFQNQTQMPVVYQACDLFCLPSRGPGESWGLAINEAMACGRAVLASDRVGSANDLIAPGENGLIFKSGNQADLDEKLEYLTSSKSRLKLYGKRSKEIIGNWNFTALASVIEQQLNLEKENK